MASATKHRWDGGYYYDTADGRVYAIDRYVDGDRRSISLRAGMSETDARGELALFNRDRAAYFHDHQTGDEASLGFGVHLDSYLASIDGRSAKHRRDMENYLERWQVLLKSKNMRRLDSKALRALLPAKVARVKMIASIKAYCGWLHAEGKLKTNPAEHLHTGAAKRSRTPKTYPIEFIEKTYAAIDSKPRGVPVAAGGHPVDALTAQAVRDVFSLAAMHGMHFSEIDRLVTEGDLHEITPPHEEIGGYAVFVHKNQDEHRQSLTVKTFAAAKRLKARGSVPVESCVREHLTRAAVAMGLGPGERLRLSRLRHAFFTNGQSGGTRVITPLGQGASMAELARSAGHKQMATSFKHYSFHQVPTLILLPYRLEHASDPQSVTA